MILACGHKTSSPTNTLVHDEHCRTVNKLVYALSCPSSATLTGCAGSNLVHGIRPIAQASRFAVQKNQMLTNWGLVHMQGQFINDRQVLLRAAEEAGISGAQQLVDNEDQLKSEVDSSFLHPGIAKTELRMPACSICMDGLWYPCPKLCSRYH